MVPGGTQRRLVAILSVDAVGYSRLMAEDEEGTARTLAACQHLMSDLVGQHGGRVVDAPGDNLLAEFPSVVDTVRCAVRIQEEMASHNADLPPERRLAFRIGVNLGDVLVEGERIVGDGVNVAARLERLAEPGGICLSGSAFDQVEGKLALAFENAGEHRVKNLPKPIRVYRVRSGPGGRGRAGGARFGRTGRAAAVVAVFGGLAVAAVWLWAPRDGSETATTPGPDADALLALPRGPGIAVLPFTNMSGDPEQDYFADGLTEDILTGLSRFSQLRVIGRNSTFRYKGRAVDTRSVGRELGVRYVLEGSVRRAASQVRVTAQLLDATTDAHLWAETYDRDLTATNLFDIQDDIREKVVASIADAYGIIARSELKGGWGRGTASLDSYECVLLAHEYNALHTAAAHLRARDCLERVVEEDPGYADAWAQLAYLNREEYHHGFNRREGSLGRALALARQAVRLDPTSPMAHLALALAHWSRGELDGFLAAAERALALNSNDTQVLFTVGGNMARAGEWDRGVALVKKAIALSPYHPGWPYLTLFYDHYRKGEYQEALEKAQRVNMPELWETYSALAQAYGQLGRTEPAQAAVANLLELYPDFPVNAWNEYRKNNLSDEDIARLVEGLRKAGLPVPESTR